MGTPGKEAPGERADIERKQELTLKFKTLRSTICIIMVIPLLVWLVTTELIPPRGNYAWAVIAITLFSLIFFIAMCGALIVFYVVQYVLEKRGVLYPEPANMPKLLVAIVVVILLVLMGSVMLFYRISPAQMLKGPSAPAIRRDVGRTP